MYPGVGISHGNVNHLKGDNILILLVSISNQNFAGWCWFLVEGQRVIVFLTSQGEQLALDTKENTANNICFTLICIRNYSRWQS